MLTSNDSDTNIILLCTIRRALNTTLIAMSIDPARIVRMGVPLPQGHLGAGQFEMAIQRDNDTTVVLRCPTSGITEETTSWRRIVENSDGCLVEVAIEDLDEPQRSRHIET